jgi:cellulose biosynthesis protein BcsQ
VDADMNKGDVHLLLDLPGVEKNIYALAKQLETFGALPREDVDRFLIPYKRHAQTTSLRVLIGIPQTWMASEKIHADGGENVLGERFVSRLLDLASPAYDFVIFDLGQTYNNPIHSTVLQRADLVFLVVNSTTTSLHAGRRALETLQRVRLLEGDRLRVVVNKYHPRHGISRREVQEALGLPAFVEIAVDEDQEVTMALNEGEPLVLSNSRAPVARNILELSATLYPPLAQVLKLQGGGKQGGLLGRLFGG